LEQRVIDRTTEVRRRSAELESLNRELEAFSYSVAHDLRAPATTVEGFAQALHESSHERLDETGRRQLERITTGAQRMQELINDLLGLSRIVLTPMRRTEVDLSAEAQGIMAALCAQAPERQVGIRITAGLVANGDRGLLRIALENLLSNAWKFTSKIPAARIEFGCETDPQLGRSYFVRDNGAGFDPRYAERLFAPFQRLHNQKQFAGTGVGLATVQRIVHRHGGQISATASVDGGACFRFTLEAPSPPEA
jgi:light-regulated signal transduction histidine kinase (bacteriophytochrome)